MLCTLELHSWAISPNLKSEESGLSAQNGEEWGHQGGHPTLYARPTPRPPAHSLLSTPSAPHSLSSAHVPYRLSRIPCHPPRVPCRPPTHSLSSFLVFPIVRLLFSVVRPRSLLSMSAFPIVRPPFPVVHPVRPYIPRRRPSCS